MPYQHLRVHREGAVESVTLDRPEVRNAFNPALVASLHEWATSIRADHAVRAVVLSGAGPAFCAGADLHAMAEAVSATRSENARDAERLAAMFEAIDDLPVPLVGRVHGAAMGGGVGLVAVCDVAVADEAASFAFSEVKLGLVPSVISPFVLAKIGRSAARELFLTARPFPAARAREIGLVHEVVPGARLDDAVRRQVDAILTAGPDAVRGAKAAIREVWGRSRAEARALTTELIVARRVSAEGQEGVRAFLEKRPPRWTRAAGA